MAVQKPSRDVSPGSDSRPGRRRADRAEHGDPRPARAHQDARPSPLDALQDMDRDILRLIARRTRLLRELPRSLSTRLERDLRAGWEAAAAKISRDPRLIRQLFALLQAVECLPRAREGAEVRQDAFTLSPARSPVDYTASCPSDCRRTRIFGALAAVSGSPLALRSVLINDPLIGLVKSFNQLGPALRWEDDGRLICRPESGRAGDKALLDRAVHVGGDMLNFLLVLFSMAARPCRLKIMGESALKLADLSSLRHFLPAMGARFTSIVPGQDGLPARLEASGMVPDRLDVPAALSADAVLALCLGLACASRARDVTVDVSAHLAAHPEAARVVDEVMEILTLADAAPRRDGTALCFAAADKPRLRMPDSDDLDLDVTVAVTLLAVPALVGGTARIDGVWPDGRGGRAAWKLLEAIGLDLRREGRSVTAAWAGDGSATGPGVGGDLDEAVCSGLDDDLLPLVTALAAQAAVRNGLARLPECVARADMAVVDDFLDHLGVVRDGGLLRDGGHAPAPWGSPSASWAVALALAAFARPGLKLLNPGIVTEFMPGFWQWYNSLPGPAPTPIPALQPIAAETEEKARPGRRRIRAGSLPEEQAPGFPMNE